ncbi:MAG: hypothetical protein JNK56_10010 [Myxococcales bacterium]|nr:hypothetical protein [Myxococcales bacterium]
MSPALLPSLLPALIVSAGPPVVGSDAPVDDTPSVPPPVLSVPVIPADPAGSVGVH